MKHIIVDEDRQFNYSIRPGPIWADACNHGKECYVCSFETFHRSHDKASKEVFLTQADLYVFPHKWYGHEVCIRTGNEGSDYISPGGLGEFLRHSNSPYHTTHRDEYDIAAQILIAFGTMTWEPRA
jgi:hypothetical protein